jgi:Carboxypeptidase regulatory-like domain
MLPRWALAGFLLASAVSFPLWAATARKGESFELRTVRGTVLTSPAVPACSAIVYLYDERTQSVRTYIADQTGHYSFSGLSAFDNYEVYAGCAGRTSKRHTISSEDERREFVIDLRISQGL